MMAFVMMAVIVPVIVIVMVIMIMMVVMVVMVAGAGGTSRQYGRANHHGIPALHLKGNHHLIPFGQAPTEPDEHYVQAPGNELHRLSRSHHEGIDALHAHHLPRSAASPAQHRLVELHRRGHVGLRAHQGQRFIPSMGKREVNGRRPAAQPRAGPRLLDPDVGINGFLSHHGRTKDRGGRKGCRQHGNGGHDATSHLLTFPFPEGGRRRLAAGTTPPDVVLYTPV